MRSISALVRNANFKREILAPFLLLCLACATPFPIENLELGMTREVVQEEFGAPSDIETGPEGVESYWTYIDEKQKWVGSFLPSSLFSIPVCAGIPDAQWDCAYVDRRPVLLHFEGEKLARWVVLQSRERPPFRFCINRCTANHNTCIAEATDTDRLESCNMEIRSCAFGCERIRGVYIEGAGGIDRADDAQSPAETVAR